MTEGLPVILYIDDIEDNLLLVKRFLAEKYRVLTAENGMDGLAVALKEKPSLILLDIMMPDMDGYEVCSRLQGNEATSYIPVVFVTALGEAKDKAKAFFVGAADYLVKPIKKNQLVEKIEKHLQTNAQWSRLQGKEESWQEKIQPSDFIRFKEFLCAEADLTKEVRFRISNTVPSDIYRVSEGLDIPEETLARYMASFTSLDYVSRINTEDIRLGVLPSAFSKSNHVIAVQYPSGKKSFIISNPFDLELVDTLVNLFRMEGSSIISITPPSNIDSLLGESTLKVKDDPLQQATTRPLTDRKSRDALENVGNGSREKPVTKITNSILNAAVTERASDIHIEPKEEDTLVRFRIDGDLRNAFSLKKLTGVMVISRLKIIGGLDIAEKRKPQDGAFVVDLGGRSFNIRLSTTSTPNGESLVMRLLEPYSEPKKLEELGMLPSQTKTMVRIANKSSGIILIVGATGSGKTTTIYSLLHNVDHEKRSLMSVEDPVEYRMPFVNQQQVNEKAGVTFEALLKTAVRQDPDVLFMGEVRDSFSAKIAINFSSTGHLTITTLHTSNATTAIFRLERLGVERGIMASALLAVVAQKLVKKLCPHCKKVVPVSPEEVNMFRPFTDDIPSMVAHASGCEKCFNTGYIGREGVYEVLELDQQLSDLVSSNVPVSEIREFIRKRGDFLISSHAIHKVKNLIVSPEDIYEKVLAEELTEKDIFVGKGLPEKKSDITGIPADQTGIEKNSGGERISPGESDRNLSSLDTTEKPAVLVVEDDEDTRKLTVHLLEKGGYQVFTADDGVEALLYLGNRRFDLILSDVDMPNLDGFKLLEMMGQKEIGTPVIMLTSRIDSEDEEKGLELGAIDYIKKPFKKELLLLRVKRTLQGRR
jgi:type II secretory ATPase GspE/PulE/Tfp pilus assembly ATPase PilB-like protein